MAQRPLAAWGPPPSDTPRLGGLSQSAHFSPGSGEPGVPGLPGVPGSMGPKGKSGAQDGTQVRHVLDR